jgi:N-terminal domain of anti-restriction factor ArdC
VTKEEKRAAQVEALENATKAVMEAEGFQRFIRARKAFHNYSINNQLLLAIQDVTVKDADGVAVEVAEGASRVAGFKTWQGLGRQVVKGAVSLKVFAPLKGKAKDDDGNVIIEANGKPRMTVYGFKLVSVFDVSQTEGEDLGDVGVSEIETADHGHLFEGLLGLAEELGVSVEEKDLSARAEGGWFDAGAKAIVIDGSAATDAKVRVLTHELAHAPGVDYKSYSRSDAEVIVETAATLALSSVGFDTSDASLGYIASWGEENGLAALRQDLKVIDEVAGRLEAALASASDREAVAA